jgi:hypothetical protein
MLTGSAVAQDSEIIVSDPVEPYFIDIDLRDIPTTRGWEPGMPIKEVPRIRRGKPLEYVQPHRPDPLLVDTTRGGSDIGFGSTISNFDGNGFSGVNPPDTVGDVGIDYFIQSINGSTGTIYSIHNKADGSLAAGPFIMDDLATGSPCNSGAGDPIILFDEMADRWVISEFAGANTLCVYVSQTTDPISGGWVAYAFNTPQFPDYPKYGVWPDGYYVTSNESTSRIHVLDRVSMLAGAPATMISTALVDLSGFNFQTATPADHDGDLQPPASAPGIIMRHRDDEVHNSATADPSNDFLELYEFTVDFATPGNSSLSPVLNIPIAEIDSSLCGLTAFACFPQPGSGTTLDPLREVVMWRLAYRNMGTHEVLVGNLVTDVDGNDTGGIRWFELRRSGGDWSLFQEGTHAPADGVNRWMGAIAMDVSGNIALGYNVTNSSDTFPGQRYVGRLADDPSGTMPQGEYTIVDGSGANGSNRYGDYSSMSVDPVDGCTFWFTGQYNTSSQWSTRVASFRFDACGCAPPDAPGTVSATPNGDNTIDVSWGAIGDAESYNVYRAVGSCPQGGFALIAEDVVGTTYADTTVSGGTTYAYVVRAYDAQEDCFSTFSACDSATATGVCLLPPVFDGLSAVTNSQEESCTITVSWAAGSTSCGGGLTYNIYRSTSSGFTPGAGNRIATCVMGTSYVDTDVESGMTYFYVVRAEDGSGNGSGPCSGGNEDTNTVEASGSPTGPDQIAFEDDLETDSGSWSSSAGPADTGTDPWTLTTTDTDGNGTSWFCSDQPVVKDQRLNLAIAGTVPAGSFLSFSHKVLTEDGFDGGVLEYSTDGGSTWNDILDGNGGSVPANADRFVQNGYSGSISSDPQWMSPIIGRMAFEGDSEGFITTVVDLADFADESLQIRFRMGCDISESETGWWVDNLLIMAPTECESGFQCDNLDNALDDWPTITILDMLTCPEFSVVR